MDIEAVLLTGGASRRMGQDKATMMVDGQPMGERIARILLEADIPVSVLDTEPIEGLPFLPDSETHAGPLAALRAFQPSAEALFVVACDLPRFDAAVVRILKAHLGEGQAAVPSVEGRRQPLCALYRATAFSALRVQPLAEARSMMAFLDALDVVEVPESLFPLHSLRSANTPEELKALLGE